MAVIIGAASTVVSPQFPNGGIASVQFGFSPQVDRLYEIGSFSPYDTSVTRTRTISLTVYGKRSDGSGGSEVIDVSPSTACVDTGATLITVNPASCAASLLPFAGSYFLNSYGYSKDQLGFGQETWGFASKPDITGFTGTIVMLRGIAEGTISTGPGVMTPDLAGVGIDVAASDDSLGNPIQGENGSVAAGTPGLGTFDIQRFIIASTVGGSTGKGPTVDGFTGQASVTIPITPVYL